MPHETPTPSTWPAVRQWTASKPTRSPAGHLSEQGAKLTARSGALPAAVAGQRVAPVTPHNLYM